MNFAAELKIQSLLKHNVPSLGFDPKGNFDEWRKSVRVKLTELLGKKPFKVLPATRIDFEEDRGDYIERRFVFTAEADADVPCHLLIPKTGRKKHPLVICLQGHSTGMHISLGRPKFEGDEELIAGGRDFALQAVSQGYAALAIEQRCFGERGDFRDKTKKTFNSFCHYTALSELLFGRTLIGLRVWDVMRAIDVVSDFAEIDEERIACMGNSGGGTVTYYSACMDPRIKIAMPSCSIATFGSSIASIDHCACNFIPEILNYFDMPDLSCLITPRPLIVVAGTEDPIFPISGVNQAFDTISRIYKAAGNEGKAKLIACDGGHRFYPEAAWPVFAEVSKWQE